MKSAWDPVNGSVPACTSVRYKLDCNPWFFSRYWKNPIRFPEKLLVGDDATKLYTCMLPFFPDQRSHETSPMVVDATDFPVDEMGPAPPRAASQIMISYSASPLTVEERKRS